jgi:hypothetical protein
MTQAVYTPTQAAEIIELCLRAGAAAAAPDWLRSGATVDEVRAATKRAIGPEYLTAPAAPAVTKAILDDWA